VPERGCEGAEAGPWWREAVLYQIYVRSFQDSDGDGVGDLDGIIARLDYLNDGSSRSLGVDALWVTPIHPSPNRDWGYDVADHLAVANELGGEAAFERLLSACHARGLRLILDFVGNHTSSGHLWFQAARAARDAPRRDFYTWRDPRPDGGAPNNWESAFGGSAWTLDACTHQYYLHSFLPEQPDLDWRNPEVVEAMHSVLRAWLGRGVDGFRLDAAARLSKDPELRDNPANPAFGRVRGAPRFIERHNRLHPDIVIGMRALRRVLDAHPSAVAFGEIYGEIAEQRLLYGGDALDGLHMVCDHRLIRPQANAPYTPWRAADIGRALAEAKGGLPAGAQPLNALANHDVPRFVTRHDGDGRGGERARAAALLLLSLPGTPCIYQGEELGLRDVEMPQSARRDPVGRDGARTPMPWQPSPGRGFSRAAPWLPFGPERPNAAEASADPDSLLSLYRRAIRTRKAEPALRTGALTTLEHDDETVLFVREADRGRPVCVALSTATRALERALPPGFDRVLLASAAAVGVGATGPRRTVALPPLSGAWLTYGRDS